ncbi:hypothetical protein HYDPIDRAFT_118520 [Hydnomerulius pinastri MD-312]|uniref:Ricin B lectin domain-containing protein n=1 Tax=Hydnomerulius pinastri MD-312 TaxID=994086 RepID=A0A0C9VP22_9AGAM|nr:hypothetical protein HYDPIDRAFT_118520 [Hydnomerulius pinastri MD-312]
MSFNITGTYFILGQTGTYLEFTDTSSSTNLTTWHFTGGPEQQWILTPAAGPTSSTPVYTVKNVKYNTYISYPTTGNPDVYVTQSSAAYDWFVETYGNGYAFASDPSFGSAWNVDDAYSDDNNPVIMYRCCDTWTLSAVSATSSSISGSPAPTSPTGSVAATTKPNVRLIVGLSVGLGGALFIVIVCLVIFRRKLSCSCKRAKLIDSL